MSKLKPKQQDILDGANAAMGKLQRNVNEKIDMMKGYVEVKFNDKQYSRVS